ncbi:MAG TPA: hypothetical protein VHP33_15235 [Polyangiaceae bacterium]|nr:hypothetical protein [Polyangiaceae bacterium]
MSELPETDWEAGARGLARELLRAGRNERATASARKVALGAFAGASAPAVTQAAAWLTLVKWLGVSAFVVGGAGVAWHATTGSREGEQSRVVVSASERPRGPAPAPVNVVASIARPPAAPSSLRSSRVAGGTRLRTSAEPVRREPPRDERLRLELEALRAARSALAEGAPARALTLLDRKVGGFLLLPLEAEIVRVEALRAAGDTSAARRLAAALLEQAGSGPYAQRLQSLASD